MFRTFRNIRFQVHKRTSAKLNKLKYFVYSCKRIISIIMRTSNVHMLKYSLLDQTNVSGVWEQIKWLRIWIYICWLLVCFFYILLFQTAKFVQGKIVHKHSVKKVLNKCIYLSYIFWIPLSVTVSICVIQVSDKSISLQIVCIPCDNGKFRVHSVLLFIHKFLWLSFFKYQNIKSTVYDANFYGV